MAFHGRSCPFNMSPSHPPQHAFIYLASQSPRRGELLTLIGAGHRPLLPGADEDAEALEQVLPSDTPEVYVNRVVAAKLAAACRRLRKRGLPPAPVLCADTTVAIGRRILGKPADAAEAAHMLQALSGRSHRVLTGVAVAMPTGARFRRQQMLHTSRVRFAELAPEDIERYIASGEPFGKAGAYGIQGRAGAFVARIEGSHSSIMGLPLHETARLLSWARVARE
jgi:septum formation protein